MKKLGIKWQRWGMLFATSVLLLPASTAWLDTIDSTTNIEQTTIESVTTSDSFLETESSVETSTTSSSIEAVTVDSTDAATESTVETSEAISTSTSETTSTFTLADYENSSALELAEAIRQKRVTSVQLVQFAFQKIHEQDDTFHAMISLREAEALKEASELEDTGQPFFGVPLIVKGLGHTIAGGSNSNGLTFAKDIVSRSTGSFVRAFQEAGFIVIGQTNYPEMGLKNITNSKLYGPTGSAWNPLYQAGGSSGGSATGVAAGYAPIGSGSDAGGSIRIPASWNGIIGMKPSRGVLVGNSASERGQTSHFAETKTMADTETLFQTFQTQELPQIPLTKDIKIAYSTKSPVGTPVEPEAVQAVETAVAFLRQQGFQVEEVEQPYDGVKLMENYYTIGASSMGIIDFLAKQQAKRPVEIDDVDWTTWALFQTSKDLTKEDVNQAWENVRQIGAELADFQEKYPLFLTPTTASTAPLLNDTAMLPEHIEAIKNMESLSKEEKLQLVYDQWLPGLTHTPFTQIANLTGTPAISLPTYVSANGLPLGIQFMAAQNNDYLLLEIGKLFEANLQFNQTATEPVPEEPTDSSSSSTESDSSVESSEETSESSTSSTESSSNEETVPSSSTEESSSTTTQTSVKEDNKQTTPSTSQSTDQETSDKKLPKTGSVRNNLPIIGGLVIVVVVGIVVWRKVRK
ncbi:amidase family protein [Candidatus Enterococcus willemsii]|uniref:Amidase n=1 Tax=Candidatus Enterococcus willemsii TaxID=1857215 RepID=A0ABQ6YYU6_9ENTE|nr:amidase family protein [Enterococcus sp. CU12B]KAF1303015.1 amidase [Enterococcus sp. CU12B]